MTRDPGPDDSTSRGSGAPATTGARTTGVRSGWGLVYLAVTVIGGIDALILLVTALFSAETGALDAVRWALVAVLLLGAAAHHWWFAGRAEERSRRIAAGLGAADVAGARRSASGTVAAVRNLRAAHPGLGLRDARDLVVQHGEPDS